MKAITLRVLSLVAVLVMSNAPATGQSGFTMGYHTYQGYTFSYYLFVPANLDPLSRYPLVLCMHGLLGDQYTPSMVVKFFGEVFADSANQSKWPSFVLVPIDRGGFSSSHCLAVNDLLDTLLGQHPIDTGRLYLTGMSMGGGNTWELISLYPDKFAAAVPVCGGAGDTSKASILRQIPLWVFNGALDDADPVRKMIAALERAGATAVYTQGLPDSVVEERIKGGATLLYTEYPDAGHNIWHRAYTEPLLLPWIFRQMYKNPLEGSAFGKWVEVQRLYVSLEGDSLIVTGAIANPESHPVTVYALVEGIATAHSDSVALYDDGRHSDGEAGDNVYGTALMASRLVEDTYNVTLITYDDSLGIRHRLGRRAIFTTTGPVLPPTSGAVTGVRYDKSNRWQYYKLVLKNAGGRVSIGNLRAGVSCNDPRIQLMNSSTAFSDSIPAGVADSSDTELCFEYADGYGPDSMRAKPVDFTVVVWSGVYPFWTSTFTFSGLVTGSVGPDAENDLPMAFGLHQNYPNPFNPSTNIKFELPKPSDVRLSVFDMLGREVSVLVNERRERGVHEVKFDGSNLASGVYFYRLKAGDLVQCRKLLLLR
jgi:pimeloyl-ACP methyl ester carboxylesterase